MLIPWRWLEMLKRSAPPQPQPPAKPELPEPIDDQIAAFQQAIKEVDNPPTRD